MRKSVKRFLSTILALTMLCSCMVVMNISAYAAETTWTFAEDSNFTSVTSWSSSVSVTSGDLTFKAGGSSDGIVAATTSTVAFLLINGTSSTSTRYFKLANCAVGDVIEVTYTCTGGRTFTVYENYTDGDSATSTTSLSKTGSTRGDATASVSYTVQSAGEVLMYLDGGTYGVTSVKRTTSGTSVTYTGSITGSASYSGDAPTGTFSYSGTSSGTFTLGSSNDFTISNLADGTYTLSYSGSDYEMTAQSVTITSQTSVTGVALSLTVKANVPVTGVSVTLADDTIYATKTTTATANITPSDATNQNVTWSSSDTAVATVATDGTVTGVAAGTANIIAKTEDGNYENYAAITVEAVSASDFDVVVGDSTTTSTTDQTIVTSAPASEATIYTEGDVTVAAAAGTLKYSNESVIVNGRSYTHYIGTNGSSNSTVVDNYRYLLAITNSSTTDSATIKIDHKVSSGKTNAVLSGTSSPVTEVVSSTNSGSESTFETFEFTLPANTTYYVAGKSTDMRIYGIDVTVNSSSPSTPTTTAETIEDAIGIVDFRNLYDEDEEITDGTVITDYFEVETGDITVGANKNVTFIPLAKNKSNALMFTTSKELSVTFTVASTYLTNTSKLTILQGGSTGSEVATIEVTDVTEQDFTYTLPAGTYYLYNPGTGSDPNVRIFAIAFNNSATDLTPVVHANGNVYYIAGLESTVTEDDVTNAASCGILNDYGITTYVYNAVQINGTTYDASDFGYSYVYGFTVDDGSTLTDSDKAGLSTSCPLQLEQ